MLFMLFIQHYQKYIVHCKSDGAAAIKRKSSDWYQTVTTIPKRGHHSSLWQYMGCNKINYNSNIKCHLGIPGKVCATKNWFCPKHNLSSWDYWWMKLKPFGCRKILSWFSLWMVSKCAHIKKKELSQLGSIRLFIFMFFVSLNREL